MSRTALAFVIFFSACKLAAQPYIDGGKTRHRFAQLTVGAEHRFVPSSGSLVNTFNSSGKLEARKIHEHHEERITIGGLHFWGHADFYISVPVWNFGTDAFYHGVETGARYFPWKIRNRKLRPYIGTAFLPVSYEQNSGPLQVKSRFPVTAGIVFMYGKHLFDLSSGYFYENGSDYYLDRVSAVKMKTSNTWFSFGYRFVIETTLSAEANWLGGHTKRITDTLAARKKLNGITLAVGPSSAFFTRNSPHTSSAFPFAGQHKVASIFTDFGLGYYFHKPDLQVNLAWRRNRSGISAYGYAQAVSRSSLALEAFKFFADYHGFAPFVGPSLSYERLAVKEVDWNTPMKKSDNEALRAGLILGWDIRPDRIQCWYLRTNLRYFPALNVRMSSGKTVFLDQLEFNFIQLVVFPGRLF